MSEDVKNTQEKKPATKICRHCRSEMDKKAKVCPTCHKKQRRGGGCLLILILLAICVAVPIFLIYSCTKAVDDVVEEDNEKAEAKKVVAEEVIFDEKGIKITYTGLEADSWNMGVEMKLKIENSTDKSIYVTAEDFSVDGYSLSSGLYTEVAPGKAATDSMYISDSDLKDSGLSSDAIKEAEVKFKVVDSNKYDTIVLSDPITIKLR